MNAIKQLRRYLVKNPGSPSSKVLARLTAAVAEEASFPLGDLYRLDGEAFDLAMELLRDWRLNRYYAARIKLFDAVLAEVGDEVGAPAKGG
jgi:hypothetical protein